MPGETNARRDVNVAESAPRLLQARGIDGQLSDAAPK